MSLEIPWGDQLRTFLIKLSNHVIALLIFTRYKKYLSSRQTSYEDRKRRMKCHISRSRPIICLASSTFITFFMQTLRLSRLYTTCRQHPIDLITEFLVSHSTYIHPHSHRIFVFLIIHLTFFKYVQTHEEFPL